MNRAGSVPDGSSDSLSGGWKSAAFRRTLLGMVRKRVPERDAEDIVQATLAEALSPCAPSAEDALQRWLFGVARHKIADRHRRDRRETFELPEIAVETSPHSERDLLRWAERALPEGEEEPRRTLEWMMREGEGEKLESIAESESLPAPRVRKRVSRLRKHLRTQWKKEIALLAALGVVAVLVFFALRMRRPERIPIARDPSPPVPSQVVPHEERSLPAVDPRTAPSSTLEPTPTPSATTAPRATSTWSEPRRNMKTGKSL